MIKVNPSAARSELQRVEKAIASSIMPDIARYKKMSNALARSKSDFNTELTEALATQAETLEGTAGLYADIIAYLYQAIADYERTDSSLVRG